MLATHRYEDRRRPYEACNIDAIVTGDGSTRVSSPDRFDDNHRPEVGPFCQRRQSRQLGHRPDPPPYRAAVRIIEGIKEVLGRTPVQLVFNVLMKGLFDRSISLFVVALQGQEIVATLVPNLRSDGRLTAHRIDGHNTTFDV